MTNFRNNLESKRNNIQIRGTMDSMLKIICALTISASLQSSTTVHGLQDSADNWEIRVRTTLNQLQNRPCRLWRDSECHSSVFTNLDTRKMKLYTAEGHKRLRVILPDRKRRRLTPHAYRNNSYDAVFVLDPFPEASFGHLVFIFLVDYDVNQTTCDKLNGVHIFATRHECIRRAEKRHCRNLPNRQVKCEINFIPLVHEQDDKSRNQLMQCREMLKTLSFAKCRAREGFDLPCGENNSPRCFPPPSDPPTFCTYEQCDHSVLVSGGWDSYTSHPRYRKNLHDVWKLLHSTMRYREKNIMTFYGQGRKEELAPKQRERSYPVYRVATVKEYIKRLCQSVLCVDTITLYLTGPSNSDGALMFWDRAIHGRTEASELYTPKQLFDDLKNCTAKRIFLVADYSYSGAMINRLESKRKRHPDQFGHIVAISSTGVGEYSWRGDFTKAFVKHNKEGNTTKCIGEVFEGIKQELRTKATLSTPQITRVNSSEISTTLNGNPCNETWDKANSRDVCRYIDRIELHGLPSKRKQP